MAEPAKADEQNLLPVQAYFDVDGQFQTFIGQGQPFYATFNPQQSGLEITDSTIDSSPIGDTTPSTGVFTNIATTTGQVTNAPVGSTDLVNKQYVDAFTAGISFKEPAAFGTTGNITLSGLTTQGGGDWPSSLTGGDRILVKNQTAQAENGVYVAASGAWSRSSDCNTWDELVSALIFVEGGNTLAGSAWYCPIQAGGTLGVTAVTWSNFAVSAVYSAGTGLNLSGYQFSIANTAVTAGSYGSASSVPTYTVNAQGQLTAASNTSISIANTQVTGLGTMSTQNANSVAISGGAINGVTIGGSSAGAITGTTITATTFSGAGTGLTGTASGLSIGGNAATATSATSATSATTATNLASGATGSVPYQSGSGATTFLPVGTNGQVLTLASGVPSWATPSAGTVTSVSGTGTVSGISLSGTVTSSGSLTLGGSLDLSSPPAIGGTTPAAITGTTVTASTKFVGPYFDAASSAGGALRNASGTAQLQWGAGGGNNVTLDVSTNLNGTNAQIDISPTGTGHVHINPTGSGSVQIAPTSAGTLDNLVIGGVTPKAGSFTTLSVSSTVSANGSVGSSGQVLTSAGAGSPAVWTSPTAYATVTDDTTTNAVRYILFANQTTGNLSTEYVSSTKLQFNPSSGVFLATSFTGAGTGLTGTASSLSIGGTAANITATSNSSLTTLSALSLPGTQVTGVVPKATDASNIATEDSTTNANFYPTFVSATGGNEAVYTASGKLKFNPSTGALTASQLIIAP